MLNHFVRPNSFVADPDPDLSEGSKPGVSIIRSLTKSKGSKYIFAVDRATDESVLIKTSFPSDELHNGSEHENDKQSAITEERDKFETYKALQQERVNTYVLCPFDKEMKPQSRKENACEIG